MGGPRTRILASHVAYNSSLISLHLSRKNIQDSEGTDIAKILFNNKTLRRLELEGNNLGPKSAREFGLALRVNTTLKFLDLESN
jgi:hypothetical protein